MEWLKPNLIGENVKPKIEKVKQLEKFAKDIGISLPQLALAWCLKNNDVSTVITGASKFEQLRENLKTIDILEKINNEVMEKIETILENNPTN